MRQTLLSGVKISLALLGMAAAPALGQSIRFAAATAIFHENAGTVSIPVVITNPGAAASTVEVALATGLRTATVSTDFTYAATQTLTFPAGATGNQTLTVPLTDDALAEAAEYFTVRLQNPVNATLTAGATEFLVFIKDNDSQAPVRAGNLGLSLLGSYQNGTAFLGNTQINSAEIVAHDPSTQRLYVANSIGGQLDILNFAVPGAITPVASISMAPYGGINSVAVRNGLVACAVEDAAPQNAGKIVFFDQNGTFIKQVTAGALPDMITFSPDGRYVVTANEGNPTPPLN